MGVQGSCEVVCIIEKLEVVRPVEVPWDAISDNLIVGAERFSFVFTFIAFRVLVTVVHGMEVPPISGVAVHPVSHVATDSFVVAPVTVAVEIAYLVCWNHGVDFSSTSVSVGWVSTA